LQGDRGHSRRRFHHARAGLRRHEPARYRANLPRTTDRRDEMIGRQVKYFFITILLILLQPKAMRILSLEDITPDILTVWVVYLALNLGQMRGMLWGFCIGL